MKLNVHHHLTSRLRIKVKCTLVQALRLCTGRTAHRESRGTVLPFHDYGTRRGSGFSVTLFTPGKDPVPIKQEVGWAPGRSRQVRKISSQPGFDSRIVQPVASRYTDYATRTKRLRIGGAKNVRPPSTCFHNK
jgi:hypothetical protein